MTIHRRLVSGGLLASLLAACSKRGGDKPAAAGPAKVRFATDWRAEAEHGGYYQALATGEYARRGLDVQIIPGGPGVNVPQLLASGAAEFGVGSNAFIVLNLAAEKAPVKAVMASFQKDPQVLIAHPDAGIKSIADMKGHPILLSDASVTAFWVWLKAKYGFTDAQVRKYTFNSAPFLADPRAVQEGYVTSEPYTIEKQTGVKPAVFLLADNGYPGYAAMILAGDRLISTRPQVVQAFVDATAAGWKSYLDGDASKADALIRKDNPEMTQDTLDQARAKLKAYGVVETPDGKVGTMTDRRWREFLDMATSHGIYPKDLDLGAAYTLAFLPKAS
jgi:NitT/TauT family transport system substrate-binding protein